MKVLVTGASGYLGGHVLSALDVLGVETVAPSKMECRLELPSAVQAMLEEHRPSVVIHCAASVPKDVWRYDDSEPARLSLRMVQHVAEHARCPIVFASSMTAENPTSAYARGKMAAEQVLLARPQSADIAVRLPGLYGIPRRTGALYSAARSFLSGYQFDLHGEPSWAGMPLAEAADILVRLALGFVDRQGLGRGLVYSPESPTIARDLPAAVQCIAEYCGVDYPVSPVQLSGMCRRRLEQFVEDVRQDLQRASTA